MLTFRGRDKYPIYHQFSLRGSSWAAAHRARRVLVKNTSQHPAFFITRLPRISGRPELGWALNFRTLWFPDTVCLFSKSQVRCWLKISYLERGSSAEPQAVLLQSVTGFQTSPAFIPVFPAHPRKFFRSGFVRFPVKGSAEKFCRAGCAWPSSQHSSTAHP